MARCPVPASPNGSAAELVADGVAGLLGKALPPAS